jgi:hypothetical protein
MTATLQRMACDPRTGEVHIAARAALNYTSHGEPRSHTDQNQMAGGWRIISASR